MICTLSADWVRRSTRPNPSRNEPRYGYQFWLNGGGDNRRWPDLPCLFVSGYTDSALLRRGLDEESVHLLPKPFSLEALTQALDRVLSRSEGGECPRSDAPGSTQGLSPGSR